MRQGVIKKFSRLPLFEGRASLYAFMWDVFTAVPPEIEVRTAAGESRRIRASTVRDRHVVKLSQIGEVKIACSPAITLDFTGQLLACGVVPREEGTRLLSQRPFCPP